jgi:hypothetical protein
VQYAVLTSATSSDPLYDAIGVSPVPVTTNDNDVAEIAVNYSEQVIITDEGGGTGSFTVVLTTQPTADVQVAVGVSDDTEGGVDRADLTFTAMDWSTPQVVTISGRDDAIADGLVDYQVTLAPATSADPNYSGLDANDIPCSNSDNDVAGVTVTPRALTVSETDGSDIDPDPMDPVQPATLIYIKTAPYKVRLNTEPTAEVTIAVTNTDSSELKVLPSLLVFNATNWQSWQQVWVTGKADNIKDGNQLVIVRNEPATSLDSGYSGLDPADVNVTVIDTD